MCLGRRLERDNRPLIILYNVNISCWKRSVWYHVLSDSKAVFKHSYLTPMALEGSVPASAQDAHYWRRDYHHQKLFLLLFLLLLNSSWSQTWAHAFFAFSKYSRVATPVLNDMCWKVFNGGCCKEDHIQPMQQTEWETPNFKGIYWFKVDNGNTFRNVRWSEIHDSLDRLSIFE